MAKILSKSGISALQVVKPGHITQSINAFTGIEAYDISLSGSFNTTGSLNVKGSSNFTDGSITASVSVGIGSSVNPQGTRAFSHGTGSSATGNFSFSQGRGTNASGFAAHAEGLSTTALGAYSHAEGRNTFSTGSYSHAQGRLTTASGDYSNAGGYGTIASGNYQLVAGQFNTPNPTDNSSFIIGNGSDTNNRSNILFAGNGKIELNAPITASSNISSSGIVYMTTASIGGGIFTSASLAAGGGGGGSTFPFTGDAQITGSLLVTGSSFISGTLLLGQGLFNENIIKVNNEDFLSTLTGFYYVGNTNNTLQLNGKYVLFNTGAVTASVDISSSATIFATTGSFSHLQGNSPITVGDQITFQQSITASGNISASGNLTALDLNLFGGDIDLKNAGAQSNIKFYCESSNAHYTKLQAAPHSAYSGNPTATLPAYDFNFAQPYFQTSITSSGNISSSANVIAKTGSFSHLVGNSPINVGSGLILQQSLTSSADLSSSGHFYGNRINAAGYISTPLLTHPSTPIEVNQHLSGSATTASFGLFEGNGSSLTNLQRPISNSIITHFTASNLNSGFYFRAGGSVTCSIQSGSIVSCDIGNEFEIFQTSSAGYVLFATGSGVTLNSKSGNQKLAGQFSGATLKKVGTDEWDLIGDLG